MKAWILSVGDEVLSGKTINTNFSTISSYFNQIGIDVIKGITIGDNRQDIIDSTISFMESDILWHYRFPHDGEEYDGALKELHAVMPEGVVDPYKEETK